MTFLRKLQNKPEEEKNKILRIAVISTAIIIITIWVLTIKFRAIEKGDTSKFWQIWNNITDAKSKYQNSK